jgi:hypothetical protein
MHFPQYSIFTFTVSPHAKNLDRAEDNEEKCNPNTNVDIISPELNCDTSGSDFKGQNNEPIEGVVPTNSETPRRCMSINLIGYFEPFISWKQTYQEGSMKRRQ